MGQIKLKVYDLSMGLIKLISKNLDQEIEAIWYTSICANGFEYYFNNSGIIKLPIGQFEKNFYLKPLYTLNYQINAFDKKTSLSKILVNYILNFQK